MAFHLQHLPAHKTQGVTYCARQPVLLGRVQTTFGGVNAPPSKYSVYGKEYNMAIDAGSISRQMSRL